MPALPPVPGVLKYIIRFTYGTDTSLSAHFYQSYTGTPPSNAQLTTYAAQLSTAAGANLSPLLGTQANYNGCEVIDLSTATGGVGIDTTIHAGTRAGGQLPASACFLYNLKIARRYRGGKPRQYWPFGTDTDLNTPQAWTGAAVTAFQNGLSAFFAASRTPPPGTATIVNLVNVSYYQGFESVQNPITLRWRNIAKPRTTPLVDLVTGSAGNPLLGSQRRRIAA